MKIRLIVPRALDEDGLAARAALIAEDALAPDVAVDCVPIKGSAAPGSDFEETLFAVAVAEAGLTAEAGGCDAVVIDSVVDPGLYALRSRLRIPVVGSGIAAYTLAVTLGGRFSIILPSECWRHATEKCLRLHDLRDCCCSIRATDASDEDDSSEDLRRALAEAGRRAVEDDGAAVVVLGSTTMPEAARSMAERLPCPVVEPGLVALKTAERLVLLELSHSKAAFPGPRKLQDEKFLPLIAPSP
jgi:allantoin racemase